MRSLREIIRLSSSLNLTANEIHRRTGVSRGTIQKILRKVREENLSWPLPGEMDDEVLEKALYGERTSEPTKFNEPDWGKVHAELKRKGVNLRLLWEEYIAREIKGYSYSQYCRRYRGWLNSCDIEMRQTHLAGDKVFVDYAGDRPRLTDRETGKVTYAELFVGVLGASNYCFAEATESQTLRCFIQSHVRMFNAFGGVPKCLTPDNLKSGVTTADRWDPTINETYRRLAEHYDCSVRPARKRKPKDKSKVEKGVQYAETWILARIRDMKFFSLQDLNNVIDELVNELNDRPFQRLGGTRRTWFEEIDKPALQKLPIHPFEFEEWVLDITVPKNYHVCVDGHHYSVPHELRREKVDVRKTDDVIEVFHKGDRVASHVRNAIANTDTTDPAHRPPAHAAYSGVTPEFFLVEARKVGKATHTVVQYILESTKYPQLGFDKCFGLLRSLREQYGSSALEKACKFAVQSGSPAYRVVKSALEYGVDALPQQTTLPAELINEHQNIRGSKQYM